jgi:hypothetical protein
MIRNVIVHLHNEQPLMADLYQMPAPTDSALVCTNLRDMNGKRPIFIDDSASYFSFSLTVVRFVEVPAASVRAAGTASPEMGLVLSGDAADAAPAGDHDAPAARPPESELEIDEDFLKRVRDF